MQAETVEKKFTCLIDLVSGYARSHELESLREAFNLSRKIHEGKKWINGDPYISHPVELATMLAGMQQDIPSLVAALIHDCVGHSIESAVKIKELLGEEVSNLLKGLDNLRALEARSQDLEKVDSLRRMLITEARDLRTMILHLADHSQAMMNLEFYPQVEKQRILDISTKVYAPLSGRLGIHRLKSRLEDLCFKHTFPGDYEEIIQSLSKTKVEREKYIAEVSGSLITMIEEKGIGCEVLGRIKHIRSIFQKMQRQNVAIEGIYDIIAFRIIVDSEQKCWEVLGILHGRWSPIPGRFRDYISLPKKNGYRSLHTSVIGPRKERIEIQIRTGTMHRVAEEGIAAHWRYKEKGKKCSTIEGKQLKWITTSLKDDSEEKKEDVFSSEIYVFTPAGTVIALPKGATPVDFAFAIHTSVGYRCSAAIVNGAMVPLSHELNSGDLVKIMTKTGQHPGKDWLDITVTSRAKTKIRSYFNAILRRERVEKGKEAVEKFLREKSISLHKMEKKGMLKKVLENMRSASIEEIYLRVASGKVEPVDIFNILQPPAAMEETGEVSEKIFEGIERISGEISVGGIGNLMVRFAGCCKPLPGDEIRGFITRGRGITIHRKNCPNFLRGDEERRIDITWDIGKGVKTRAGLKIVTEDTPGILARLTQFISSKGINVRAAKSERTRDGNAVNLFTFEISSTSELVSLIRSLEKVSGVKLIERV